MPDALSIQPAVSEPCRGHLSLDNPKFYCLLLLCRFRLASLLLRKLITFLLSTLIPNQRNQRKNQKQKVDMELTKRRRKERKKSHLCKKE